MVALIISQANWVDNVIGVWESTGLMVKEFMHGVWHTYGRSLQRRLMKPTLRSEFAH